MLVRCSMWVAPLLLNRNTLLADKLTAGLQGGGERGRRRVPASGLLGRWVEPAQESPLAQGNCAADTSPALTKGEVSRAQSMHLRPVL